MERLKGKKLYIGLLVFFLSGIFLFAVLKDKMFVPNNVASVEWLIEPKFYKASNFSSGVAWVQEKENGPWKLIDTTEKVIVDNFRANSISGYDKETGLAQFRNSENLTGFVNLSGEVVISPEYRFVGSFRHGMVGLAKKIDDKELSGVINHSGNIVMPMVYEGIHPISPNLFTVKKEGKWGAVNKKGEVVIGFLSEEPLEPISQNALAAIVATKDMVFDAKRVYTPGYQRVGLISDTGQWILPASYDQIYPEGEGLIGLEKDRKAGFMDPQGNLVIDFKFAGNALPGTVRTKGDNFFSEGLATVALTRDSLAPPFVPVEKLLNAVIDRTGKTVFEFQGYVVDHFIRGLLVICRSEEPYKYELRNRFGDSYSLPSGMQVWTLAEDPESNGIILLVQMGEKGKYGYLKVTPK